MSMIPGNNWSMTMDDTIVPFASEVDGTSLSSSNGVLSVGPVEQKSVNVVTASGTITCSSTENYVVVKKTTGAATAVTLPASPTKGMMVVIKDGKGDAATNNITVSPASGLIDAGADFIMNVNYQTLRVIYNGTSWNIV